MPKRVLVPSLKVKRLTTLFDSSPTKMPKGKNAGTNAATVLAHMDVELGREEAATSIDLAALAADKSNMGMLATFVASTLVAKKSDSDLTAGGSQQRRHSDGEGGTAAGTGLAASVFQTPK
jgi:hypothetical protein